MRRMEQQQHTGKDCREITRAKNTAYRLLALRSRSRAELVQKLQGREFGAYVIDSVMADLDRLGYINDLEFAVQWAANRVRLKGFGRRRIEQELRRKGIAPDVIRAAVSEAVPVDDEVAAARKAAEKKLRTLNSVGPDVRRRRLAGFLERQGYSIEIIRSLLTGRTDRAG